MELYGSCCCEKINFKVISDAPVPFMRCYCSICRKTNGGGGFATNLGARFETLETTGETFISKFNATIDGKVSTAQRSFCSKCGTSLWLWDPRWPDLVHPFASAIDTPLPIPPHHTNIMLGSKANWCQLDQERSAAAFDAYPDMSLAQWHAEFYQPKK